MKTLFIGAYGFRNLGDDLCLIEAIESFPSSGIYVRSVDPQWTSKIIKCDGFIDWKLSPAKVINQFERIVLGGGGLLDKIHKDYFQWIYLAQKKQIKNYIHNIGLLSGNINWINSKYKESFEKTDGFTVRDEITLAKLKSLGIKRKIDVCFFPERKIPSDPALVKFLDQGPFLGIAIDNKNNLLKYILKNKDKIKNILQEILNHYSEKPKILPIIQSIHPWEKKENDILSFNIFYQTFLKDFKIALHQILNKEWWLDNLTPQRLKGLIEKCQFLFFSRKHSGVLAFESNVNIVGISLKNNPELQIVFHHLQKKNNQRELKLFLIP